MLRFVYERHELDNNNGLNDRSLHTVDVNVPELESILRAGGRGPQGFELFRLKGVEIIDDAEQRI